MINQGNLNHIFEKSLYQTRIKKLQELHSDELPKSHYERDLRGGDLIAEDEELLNRFFAVSVDVSINEHAVYWVGHSRMTIYPPLEKLIKLIVDQTEVLYELARDNLTLDTLWSFIQSI